MTHRSYSGRLAIGDAPDGPPVALRIEGSGVVVTTPDGNDHLWPADDVHCTGVASPRFGMEIGGESCVFTADEASAFMFTFLPALEALHAPATDHTSQNGAHTELAHTELAHTELAHTELAHTEPTDAEPGGPVVDLTDPPATPPASSPAEPVTSAAQPPVLTARPRTPGGSAGEAAAASPVDGAARIGTLEPTTDVVVDLDRAAAAEDADRLVTLRQEFGQTGETSSPQDPTPAETAATEAAVPEPTLPEAAVSEPAASSAVAEVPPTEEPSAEALPDAKHATEAPADGGFENRAATGPVGGEKPTEAAVDAESAAADVDEVAETLAALASADTSTPNPPPTDVPPAIDEFEKGNLAAPSGEIEDTPSTDNPLFDGTSEGARLIASVRAETLGEPPPPPRAKSGRSSGDDGDDTAEEEPRRRISRSRYALPKSPQGAIQPDPASPMRFKETDDSADQADRMRHRGPGFLSKIADTVRRPHASETCEHIYEPARTQAGIRRRVCSQCRHVSITPVGRAPVATQTDPLSAPETHIADTDAPLGGFVDGTAAPTHEHDPEAATLGADADVASLAARGERPPVETPHATNPPVNAPETTHPPLVDATPTTPEAAPDPILEADPILPADSAPHTDSAAHTDSAPHTDSAAHTDTREDAVAAPPVVETPLPTTAPLVVPPPAARFDSVDSSGAEPVGSDLFRHLTEQLNHHAQPLDEAVQPVVPSDRPEFDPAQPMAIEVPESADLAGDQRPAVSPEPPASPSLPPIAIPDTPTTDQAHPAASAGMPSVPLPAQAPLRPDTPPHDVPAAGTNGASPAPSTPEPSIQPPSIQPPSSQPSSTPAAGTQPETYPAQRGAPDPFADSEQVASVTPLPTAYSANDADPFAATNPPHRVLPTEPVEHNTAVHHPSAAAPREPVHEPVSRQPQRGLAHSALLREARARRDRFRYSSGGYQPRR